MGDAGGVTASLQSRSHDIRLFQRTLLSLTTISESQAVKVLESIPFKVPEKIISAIKGWHNSGIALMLNRPVLLARMQSCSKLSCYHRASQTAILSSPRYDMSGDRVNATMLFLHLEIAMGLYKHWSRLGLQREISYHNLTLL